MKDSLDHVVLHFNKESLLLLNLSLAFIMFGVALDLKPKHFLLLLKAPKPIIVGLISQFLFLPFVTFVLIYFLEPSPSMALGMMLVAACPGGNVSNFYSSLSKGNVALSVSLTAISSSLAVVMTPLNFTFWSGMYAPTAKLIQQVNLDVNDVILTIFLILIIPLILGMLFNHKYQKTTTKISGSIRKLSILVFAAFVVIALGANFDYFIKYIFAIFFIVLLHNVLALATGNFTSRVAGLDYPSQKSITIETGIQNSGLALVLIFDYFEGLGGMAIIAAWWGVWHLISGGVVSWFWADRSSP